MESTTSGESYYPITSLLARDVLKKLQDRWKIYSDLKRKKNVARTKSHQLLFVEYIFDLLEVYQSANSVSGSSANVGLGFSPPNASFRLRDHPKDLSNDLYLIFQEYTLLFESKSFSQLSNLEEFSSFVKLLAFLEIVIRDFNNIPALLRVGVFFPLLEYASNFLLLLLSSEGEMLGGVPASIEEAFGLLQCLWKTLHDWLQVIPLRDAQEIAQEFLRSQAHFDRFFVSFDSGTLFRICQRIFDQVQAFLPSEGRTDSFISTEDNKITILEFALSTLHTWLFVTAGNELKDPMAPAEAALLTNLALSTSPLLHGAADCLRLVFCFLEPAEHILTPFFDTFSSLFQKAIHSLSSSNPLLEKCLTEVLGSLIVIKDDPEKLRVLIDTGVCVSLVRDLLSSPHRTRPNPLLESRICIFLSYLIVSSGSQVEFETTIGYQTLFQGLANDHTFSKESIDWILFVAVGTKVSLRAFSPHGNYNIRNFAILNHLLLWLPCSRLNSDSLLDILRMIHSLVARSLSNVSRCCKSGMLTAVLTLLSTWREGCDREVLTELLEYLKLLGGHSVAPSELTLFLNMLYYHSPLFRPDLYFALQDVAHLMMIGHNPSHFFDLSGVESALSVPNVARIGPHGFTFMAWVRIHSFSNPSGPRTVSEPILPGSHAAQRYEPRLFHFTLSSGRALEAYFIGGKLCLSSTSKKGRSTFMFNKVEIPSKKWLHISIVHASPKSFLSDGEVKLYIQGELMGTGQLELPPMQDQTLLCTIGADPSPLTSGADELELTSLRAQIASFSLFSGALTDFQIATICSLGFNYWGILEPASFHLNINHSLAHVSSGEWAYLDEQDAAQRALAEANLTGRLVCHVSAKLCDGVVFREQIRYSLNAKESECHFPLNGVELCVHRSLKTVITSMGGVQVFGLLLSQLDAVVHQLGPQDEARALAKKATDCFINLIAAFLKNSRSAASILETKFLTVINVLLRESKSAILTVESLMTIQKVMLEYASPYAQFVRAVMSNLVFDFAIWTRSDSDARAGQLGIIAHLIREHPLYCRNHYGILFFLESLCTIRRLSDECGRSRDAPREKDIRDMILGIILEYIKDSFSSTELSTMVEFCASCDYPDISASVLRLLRLSLLSYSKLSSNIENAFVRHGAPVYLYAMLKSHSEHSSEVLWLIAYFSHNCSSLSDKQKAEMLLYDVGMGGFFDDLSQIPLNNEIICALFAIATFPSGDQVVTEAPVDDGDAVLISVNFETKPPLPEDLDFVEPDHLTSLHPSSPTQSINHSAPSEQNRRLPRSPVPHTSFVLPATIPRSVSQSFESIMRNEVRRSIKSTEALGMIFRLIAGSPFPVPLETLAQFCRMLASLFEDEANCRLYAHTSPDWTSDFLGLLQRTYDAPLLDMCNQTASNMTTSYPFTAPIQAIFKALLSFLWGLLKSDPTGHQFVIFVFQYFERHFFSRNPRVEFSPAHVLLLAKENSNNPQNEPPSMSCTSDPISNTTDEKNSLDSEDLELPEPHSPVVHQDTLKCLDVALSTSGVDTFSACGASITSFKAWILMDLFHYCISLLQTPEFSEEDHSSLMTNMIHLCMMAEEQLFCFPFADDSVAAKESLDVLTSGLLAFVEQIEASYDKYYGNIDFHTTSGDTEKVRPGGLFRIVFRITLENLSSSDFNKCVSAANTLKELLADKTESNAILSTELFYCLLYHLDIAFKRFQAAGLSDHLNLILPLWQKAFTVSDIKWLHGRFGSLRPFDGKEDARLTEQAPYPEFVRLISSDWWSWNLEVKVQRIAESVMDLRWVERGANVRDVGLKYNAVLAALDVGIERFETHRDSSRVLFKENIRSPFFRRQMEHDLKMEQREHRVKVHRRHAIAYYRERVGFFTGPRGVFHTQDHLFFPGALALLPYSLASFRPELEAPDSVLSSSIHSLEYDPQYFGILRPEYLHSLTCFSPLIPFAALRARAPRPSCWVLDPAENFNRMRMRVVPEYDFEPDHYARFQSGQEPGPTSSKISARGLFQSLKKSDSPSYSSSDVLSRDDFEPMDFGEETHETVVYSVQCEMVLYMEVVNGSLYLTTSSLAFYSMQDPLLLTPRRIPDFKYNLGHLREVHHRRYNLHPTALELFFIDQTNYFLNFKPAIRDEVFRRIVGLKPPMLIYTDGRGAAELLAQSHLTEKWQRREISNFDYLMQLNTIAGRSYNDIHQYPIFPWVLADYTSPDLDLSDPAVYRDLSKPVGALHPSKARDAVDRYSSFTDPDPLMPAFHHGTHYSNAAIVLFYLFRIEPFTTMHIALHDGHFDFPNRLFHSIESTWRGVLTGSGDVKELIPEFYYFPEFLENSAQLPLGKLGNGRAIGDVMLPPWAKSPNDFVRILRQALESEYVSMHLNEWIDLIFGHKQRGQHAVDALNVFYHTAYEGSINLDSITDEKERFIQEGMIREFGQIPSQLFTAPHPVRASLLSHSTFRQTVFSLPRSIKGFSILLSAEQPLSFLCLPPKMRPVDWAGKGIAEPLVTVTREGILSVHDWIPEPPASFAPTSKSFPFVLDADMTLPSTQFRFLHGGSDLHATPSSKTMKMSPDGRYLFCGASWDNTIKVFSVKQRMTLYSAAGHNDVVTCLALDERGQWLVSGCKDGSCMLWRLNIEGTSAPAPTLASPRKTQPQKKTLASSREILEGPVSLFFGHDAPVTDISVNSELDMLVSVSMDGTCNIHTLSSGQYIQSLRPPPPSGPSLSGSVRNLSLSEADLTDPRGLSSGTGRLSPRPSSPDQPPRSKPSSPYPDHNSSGHLPPSQASPPLSFQDTKPSCSIQLVKISRMGHVVIYVHWVFPGSAKKKSYSLYVFSCNGRLVVCDHNLGSLLDFALSVDSKSIILVSRRGIISFRDLSSLGVMHTMDVRANVHSMALTSSEAHLLLGLADGNLLIAMLASKI